MKKYRIIDLRGNKDGDNFDPEGKNVGDIVTEEEVARYCKECNRFWEGVEHFNEVFSTQIEEVKEMTKDDLRTGMWIETQWGKGQVLLDTTRGAIVSGENWFPLNSYSDDDLFGSGQRVIRVYEIHELNSCAHKKPGEIIYERQEKSAAQLEIEKLEETIKKASEQIEELKAKV